MNNLAWRKLGDAYYLASPNEELVKIQLESGSKAVFWMNNEVYEVKRSGFWNQRYAITRGQREIAVVTHTFWGSTGKISLYDGTTCTSEYHYSSKLTMRFAEGSGEILRYQAVTENGVHKPVLTLGISMVDADKLLLLATLGMVMFLNFFNEFENDGDVGAILLATSI